MHASRGTIAGALLLAASLLGPASYAGPADESVSATPREDRAAAKPLVRVGELLKPSPTQRYRFQGKKGQRVVVAPDGWPNAGHGCLYKNQVRRGGVLLPTGAIGDWRLPRTATYELRVGRTCVARMPLRLRRYERPIGRIGATLPTTFTRTLMRSVRLTLPRTGPVIFERVRGDGFVLVTNTSATRDRFEGCATYILTAGLRWWCTPGRVERDVVVSAPAASTVRRAKVVDVEVDGAPITVEDPARTLIRIEVTEPTAVRVESNAVPVPRTLAERDWVEMLGLDGQWGYYDFETYRTPGPGDTWLPSGWKIERSGHYLFQVVDAESLPAGEPLTFAARTSVDPPPGEVITPPDSDWVKADPY